MKPIRYFLRDAGAIKSACQFIWRIEPNAERPMVVEIKEMTRSDKQNSLLHVLLTDISKQCTVTGQSFDLEIWKRLCVASFLRERNEKPLLIPSLDRTGVDIIYEKTSKMSVTMLRDLIEWCYAYGAENNVKWSEPKAYMEWLQSVEPRRKRGE